MDLNFLGFSKISYPFTGIKDIDTLSKLIQCPFIGTFYRHRFKMVADLLDLPLKKGLEIGYGAGFMARLLGAHVDEYWGVDIHEKASEVDRFLREQGKQNIHLAAADARNLHFFKTESFDTAFSVSCLEHIKERNLVQAEIFRVLKNGGVAVHGMPIKNLVTRFLFKTLGYDDRLIHPTTHDQVKAAALETGFLLTVSTLP